MITEVNSILNTVFVPIHFNFNNWRSYSYHESWTYIPNVHFVRVAYVHFIKLAYITFVNTKESSPSLSQYNLYCFLYFLFLVPPLFCIPSDFLFCWVGFPQRPILIVDCLKYNIWYCYAIRSPSFPLSFGNVTLFCDAEIVPQ